MKRLVRVQKKLEAMPAKVIPAAEAAALNKVARRINKGTVDRLAQRLNSKKKYIAKSVKDRHKRVIWTAADHRKPYQRARVIVATKAMSLSKMGPRQAGRGIKAGPFNVPGAFMHDSRKRIKNKTPGWGGVVVGKRLGKERRPVRWQSKGIAHIAGPILRRYKSRAGGQIAREMKDQMDKRVAKYMGGI